jgi:hypothetical protein
MVRIVTGTGTNSQVKNWPKLFWTNPEGEYRITFPAATGVYDFIGAADKIGIAAAI